MIHAWTIGTIDACMHNWSSIMSDVIWSVSMHVQHLHACSCTILDSSLYVYTFTTEHHPSCMHACMPFNWSICVSHACMHALIDLCIAGLGLQDNSRVSLPESARGGEGPAPLHADGQRHRHAQHRQRTGSSSTQVNEWNKQSINQSINQLMNACIN